MGDYPHVNAAFINAIAEEGTKAEAVQYLQKQWNETCTLRARLEQAERGMREAESKAIEWHKMWLKASTQGFRAGIEAAGKCAIDNQDCSTWEIAEAIRALSPTDNTMTVAEAQAKALFNDAFAEAQKAVRKFPQPNYVISKVAEEAGEVVKAAIHCAEGRETPENVISEIKQAMAMLIRLYIEGDQVHGLRALAAQKGDE